MYRAILGRDADPEGLASYLNNPARPRGPSAVVGALLDSEEFQRRNFGRHAPELARAFYRGLFGREPDAEGLAGYTARLARREDLADALESLLASEEFQHRAFERFAPDLARAFFQGVLGREADEAGLAAYSARLSRKENVADALESLLASEEFRRKVFGRLGPDLVRIFHEGLLERGADEAAAEAYAARLAQGEDAAGVLKEIAGGEEFERRTFERLAPNLAQAFFQGVLGREADPDGLATYVPKLTRKENLAEALACLIDSDEFRHRALGMLSPDLIQSFYQGVLGREADGNGLATYAARLSQHGDAGLIVSHLMNSQEFKNKSVAPDRLAAPLIDGKCWVFLHIAKTAGTSVQNLLGSFYTPGDTLYREHADNLSKRDPADLARYEMFAGHFGYDSLVYLPRRNRLILTFVREPVARLCSFYYFRRAHEPGHPTWGFQEQAANELDLKAFFQNRAIRRSRDLEPHDLGHHGGEPLVDLAAAAAGKRQAGGGRGVFARRGAARHPAAAGGVCLCRAGGAVRCVGPDDVRPARQTHAGVASLGQFAGRSHVGQRAFQEQGREAAHDPRRPAGHRRTHRIGPAGVRRGDGGVQRAAGGLIPPQAVVKKVGTALRAVPDGLG